MRKYARFAKRDRGSFLLFPCLCTVNVHSKAAGLNIKPVLYGTLKQDTLAWTPLCVHYLKLHFRLGWQIQTEDKYEKTNSQYLKKIQWRPNKNIYAPKYQYPVILAMSELGLMGCSLWVWLYPESFFSLFHFYPVGISG